jgi:hypothetical protein
MAASVALLATACGTKAPYIVDGQPSGAPSSTAGPGLTAGALLISNGTDTVTIGGKAVKFPSTVTDATWSPDGSRIAYIDGDGNVATAKPDGSGVLVLTATDKSVVRSRPSWSRAVLFYAEKKGADSTLMSVPINGCGDGSTVGGTPWNMDTGDGTSYVDLAPSAAFSYKPARVSFQHNEPSGPQIWINDTNQRSPGTYKVINGSEPALSPDGKRLAYVGINGQMFLTTAAYNGGAGVQITFGANHPTRPVWSPDGQHIAYETATDIESVGLSPGANANPATTLSSKPGVPAFLSATRTAVARITGPDPIAVSIAASQARWPTEDTFFPYQGYFGAQEATIATPGQALVASQIGHYFGPLLLTSGTSLDPRTKAELQRIFGALEPNGEPPDVTIAGDEVSSAVDQALKALGYKVVRESGKAVADNPAGDCGPQKNADLASQWVIVVDPSSDTDDAAATSMAASWYVPILRLHGGKLDDAAKAYLTRSAAALESVYIVDSTGAISTDVQKQIGDLISGPGGFDTRLNPAYVAP